MDAKNNEVVTRPDENDGQNSAAAGSDTGISTAFNQSNR